MRRVCFVAFAIPFFQRKKVYNLTTSQLIRGEYQNKIRRHSAPQKIFQTFATNITQNGIDMSLKNLFTALLPFPYSVPSFQQQQSQVLQFNSKYIKQFADIDQDGHISINEYFNIVSLLSTSKKQIMKYFDQRNIERIGEKDIVEFFTWLNCRSSNHLVKKTILQSRKTTTDSRTTKQIIKGTAHKILRKQQFIKKERITQIYDGIYDELMEYQFAPVQGKIPGDKFAKSIICYLQTNKIRNILSALKNQQFPGVQIDLKEYKGFHRFLQQGISQIQKISAQKGSISRQQLRNIVNNYRDQMSISKESIDIFFKVVDSDSTNYQQESGFLQKRQIINVLQQRNFYGMNQSQLGIKKSYNLLITKISQLKRKLIKIYEIILQ